MNDLFSTCITAEAPTGAHRTSILSAAPSKGLARIATLAFGAFILTGCGAIISPPDPQPPLGECFDDSDCRAEQFCNFDANTGETADETADNAAAIAIVAGVCEDKPSEPTACASNQECGENQFCDNVNYCEQDPSCEPDEPCIELCFGRCVDAPISDGCLSDADCGREEFCNFTGNVQPADNPSAVPVLEGICEPKPTGCYADNDCSDGDICDTQNYCDAPPGCQEGMNCPAVCYGRCTAPIAGCFADSDCAADEFCRYADASAPAPDSPRGIVAPEGVCVPSECNTNDIALPACPPNTRPVSIGGEGCGEVICEVIDDCSQLSPDECRASDNCNELEIPVPCDCPIQSDPNADPEPCACAQIAEVICVAASGCEGLAPDLCEQNPECEGFYLEAPSDCAPSANGEACTQPAPDFICTERQLQDGCRHSRDCAPNERCEAITTCTDECIPSPAGDVDNCLSECWETRECVVAETSCYDLPEWECTEDPRCQLTEGGLANRPEPAPCDPNDASCAGDPLPAPPMRCEPRPNPSCRSDDECGAEQHCEIKEWCAQCDATEDPDFLCNAPCWAEGICVDGREPPQQCEVDADCAANEECQFIEVCENGCGSDAAGAPTDACVNACSEQALCVPVSVPEVCYSDDECGLGLFCKIDPTCATTGSPANGLMACSGTCQQAPDEQEYCLQNADCRDGQRCATELEICYVPPAGPYDVCYSLCVDDTVPPPSADNICLIDADCADTERCATELDVCVCDPNDDACSTCYSSCVANDEPPLCADVLAYAADPDTGTCQEFATPCNVPEGWLECSIEPIEPPLCADVLAYAADPDTGTCQEFATPCDVPEGWLECSIEPIEPPLCEQVITSAADPDTGVCREFATPCDVPEGWRECSPTP